MCQKCLIFTDNETCLNHSSFVDSGNKFKSHSNNRKEFLKLTHFTRPQKISTKNSNAVKENQHSTDPTGKLTWP